MNDRRQVHRPEAPATALARSDAADRVERVGFESDFLSIVEACKSPQISFQLRHDLANEKDGARRLDGLCATLIAMTLSKCGVFDQRQSVVSVGDICDRMSVRDERRPQIQRLVDVLQEEGWVCAEPGGYRWLAPALPAPAQVAADAAALEADFPFAAGVTGLLLRCMAALPAVVSGNESAVAVLFASGSVTELEVFYSRFPLLALANAMAARAVARIAGLGYSGRLNVLEVGAGTGALTAALLPALGEHLAQYVYSDISPSFLAHGRRKFSACTALRPMIVDIDKDLSAQGLKHEGFDLVLGSNVVHAVPDVRRALRHLRQALRPGGHLVLVETVLPSRVADCTVGLLDGWWSFRDSALRDGYPLLGTRQWLQLLREEGFRVAAVPVGGRADATPTGVALLMATKLDATIASR